MKDLALKIIKISFRDKKDKAGEPYVNHLVRVSNAVPDYGLNKELKIIALLHDLLEDCPEWSEKALRALFTDDIVDRVVLLTRKPDQTYHEYITEVLKDGWATVVKQHDLEDNMNITRLNDLTQEDFERLKKYHKAYKRIKSN